MLKKDLFNEKLQKLKKVVVIELKKGNIDKALRTIDICARIFYEFNQTYVDNELEGFIIEISNKILETSDLLYSEWHSDKILFYDGFGLDNRGLAQIYLKALCSQREVIYVTYAKRKSNIPDITKILDSYNVKKFFIEDGERISQIKELNRIIQSQKPGKLMMYTFPNDVVVTTVYTHYAEKLMRYQINLTDHAFWLGVCAMDKCIEFRDYGASISYLYRNIDKESIYKLPFYPIINYDCPFEGYPFETDERKSQKVIFSGGALYKTIGGGNKYYKIVDYILRTYPDTLFWYAGSGNRTEMDKLIAKYPNRVYLTKERRDLYQVLKRCFFYLSTYPISGGLMFQYAAMAEKIPITLKYDQDTEGFLLRQNELNIEFESLEELCCEVDKLFLDAEYKMNKEKVIRAAVVDEDEFSMELERILDAGKNTQDISIEKMDIKHLRQEYWARHTQRDLYEMLVRKDGKFLAKYFPIEYAIGFTTKIMKKIKNISYKADIQK